jgi:tripartite ATP-independent transporter DctP family solute receptor
MGKRALGLRLAAAALLIVGTASNALAEKVVKVGLTLPQNIQGFDHVNGMYEAFKKEVETATKGSLKVELVYGGALGNAVDRMNQMRRGIIQMSDASDGNYATVFPDIQVLSTPYLFPTEQIAWKVFDGPYGAKMAEDIRKATGIRVLGWWEAGGFRQYSANKPIHSVKDMAGLKMRALGPANAKPVEAAGGSATPIAFNELYTSLKTGVVDGQDNAVNVFRLVKLYEVQKYLVMSGHSYSFGPLGMNDAFYNGLTKPEQAAIDEAAKKAIAFNRQTSRKGEAEALEFIKTQGVTVITLTPEAKAEFARVMQPPVLEWLKGQVTSPKVIDDALAAVKAASN